MKKKIAIYGFLFIGLIFLVALNYSLLNILFKIDTINYLIITNILVPIEVFVLKNKIDNFIRRL